MRTEKEMNGKPTLRSDVLIGENTGLPTDREVKGNGVLIVVSGWESHLHGEGE